MLKLISYTLCPFVHRAAITLRAKGIPYDIEYIDLRQPPDWFRRLSPLGKVPLLLVGEEALFESIAIMEYLDEAYPPRLHPEDLIRRAKDRAWMLYSDTSVRDLYRVALKEDETGFRQALARLHGDFDQLESAVAGPFFAGEAFSLVDAAYGPMFFHLHILTSIYPDLLDAQRHPRIAAWQATLVQHPAVTEAVVPDFRERYLDWLSMKDSYLARLLLEQD